jgi:hypothetical protein
MRIVSPDAIKAERGLLNRYGFWRGSSGFRSHSPGPLLALAVAAGAAGRPASRRAISAPCSV